MHDIYMLCHVGLVIEAKFVRFDVVFPIFLLDWLIFLASRDFFLRIRLQVLTTSPFFGGQAESHKNWGEVIECILQTIGYRFLEFYGVYNGMMLYYPFVWW